MKEAVAYFVLLMNYSANGDIDDFVINTTLNTLARCPLFGDNTQDEDLNLLARLEDLMKDDANGHALAYAQVLEHDDWKFTAAALMADVMLADGAIDDGEIQLLTDLAGEARIDPDDLNAIIGTVSALRRAWDG